jgi:hypothetical protein
MEEFKTLCGQAFTPRRGMSVPMIKEVFKTFNLPKYETQPLELALRKAFTADQYLFGGPRSESESSSMAIKVAVTATSATHSPVIFTNYNRVSSGKCKNDILGSFDRG